MEMERFDCLLSGCTRRDWCELHVRTPQLHQRVTINNYSWAGSSFTALHSTLFTSSPHSITHLFWPWEESASAMFFTKFAEKSGLLDILAPHHRSSKRKEGNKDTDTVGGSSKEDTTYGRSNRPQQESIPSREEGAASQQRRRERMIRAQFEAEKVARRHHRFAKNQRVSYHHKASNSPYDSFIVAVHLDDGPDRPYYVSRIKIQFAWPFSFFFRSSFAALCWTDDALFPTTSRR